MFALAPLFNLPLRDLLCVFPDAVFGSAGLADIVFEIVAVLDIMADIRSI
jgi:hypothetical protein